MEVEVLDLSQKPICLNENDLPTAMDLSRKVHSQSSGVICLSEDEDDDSINQLLNKLNIENPSSKTFEACQLLLHQLDERLRNEETIEILLAQMKHTQKKIPPANGSANNSTSSRQNGHPNQSNSATGNINNTNNNSSLINNNNNNNLSNSTILINNNNGSNSNNNNGLNVGTGGSISNNHSIINNSTNNINSNNNNNQSNNQSLNRQSNSELGIDNSPNHQSDSLAMSGNRTSAHGASNASGLGSTGFIGGGADSSGGTNKSGAGGPRMTREMAMQALDQQYLARKALLRKQADKALSEVPLARPPQGSVAQSDLNLIPSTATNEFVALVGLEEVVKNLQEYRNLALGHNTNEVRMVFTPFNCVQCGTDFTPLWKRERPGSSKVVCESCCGENYRRALQNDYQDKIRLVLKKYQDQERDLDRDYKDMLDSPKKFELFRKEQEKKLLAMSATNARPNTTTAQTGTRTSTTGHHHQTPSSTVTASQSQGRPSHRTSNTVSTVNNTGRTAPTTGSQQYGQQQMRHQNTTTTGISAPSTATNQLTVDQLAYMQMFQALNQLGSSNNQIFPVKDEETVNIDEEREIQSKIKILSLTVDSIHREKVAVMIRRQQQKTNKSDTFQRRTREAYRKRQSRQIQFENETLQESINRKARAALRKRQFRERQYAKETASQAEERRRQGALRIRKLRQLRYEKETESEAEERRKQEAYRRRQLRQNRIENETLIEAEERRRAEALRVRKLRQDRYEKETPSEAEERRRHEALRIRKLRQSRYERETPFEAEERRRQEALRVRKLRHNRYANQTQIEVEEHYNKVALCQRKFRQDLIESINETQSYVFKDRKMVEKKSSIKIEKS